ncbi:sigma-70 family RNA polymerase sigma factor [Streptomyces sp. NPDC088847]|uniref:sigma-70 family RNA polymerase sigma factor n=1 Tax=Streptomyces sp. NPDC088847 TaxID=3365909 RepID=UPI00380F31F5
MDTTTPPCTTRCLLGNPSLASDGVRECGALGAPHSPGVGFFGTNENVCVLDADFTQFVIETETRLYWFALRLCRSDAQAKDMVQSGYLKLWVRWNDLCSLPPERKRALAYTTVRHVYIDYLRVKSNLYTPSDLADYDVADDSAVDEELIATENAREVLQAVEKLPDRFREVITAVDLEGSTLAAYAESQGLTPKRASRYRIKALQLLREILGER